MTSPIKPPGGPKPPIDPKADSVSDSAKGRGADFKEAVGQVDATSTQKVDDSAQALVSDLAAGKIDTAGAVDRLVAQALSAPAAATLNEAGKAALEKHLRESLASDPNLSEMVKGLSVE